MFIIKIRCEATKENTDFEGIVNDYYYGKDEHFLSKNEFPVRWLVNEYGYKRYKDAERKARNMLETDINDKYLWTKSYEIIEA